METTTLYNLDDIFYDISRREVFIWAINNILISAVGHRIIYELKETSKDNNIMNVEEPKLQKMIEKKELVITLDKVRGILKERMENIIKEIENNKKEFMKNKLKRTLNGNMRKAKNSLKGIRDKLNSPNDIKKDENVDAPGEGDYTDIENSIEKIYRKAIMNKFKKGNSTF